MRFSGRNGILTIVTVSFVAMVTGASVHLHMLGRDHQDVHDLEACSVCQQFLAGSAKFTQESKCELPDQRRHEHSGVSSPSVRITASYHLPFVPRAPPAA